MYARRIPRTIVAVLKNNYDVSGVRQLSTWEEDPKSGYVPLAKGRAKEPSFFWHVRNGFRLLGGELKLFKKEVIERFEDDPYIIYRKNEIDPVWQFNGDEKSLDQWIVTADSDYGEGYSSCSLKLTKLGKGIFSGYLDKRVPKTGNLKKAGYCNIRTVRPRKSFKREMYHNWHAYNHLVMRVRGDGRSYMLNISTPDYFDLTWNDVYHYVLYTRGGPYWQYVKIPFSKFILASKGRVQDRQQAIPLDSIVSFGISAADRATGPFSLEIDYIGLIFDPNHTEEFAYEMYRTDDYVSGY